MLGKRKELRSGWESNPGPPNSDLVSSNFKCYFELKFEQIATKQQY
jgi:hypothetical protein